MTEIMTISTHEYNSIGAIELSDGGIKDLATKLARVAVPSGISAEIEKLTSIKELNESNLQNALERKGPKSKKFKDRAAKDRTDLAVAKALHQHLGITKAQAAEPALWASLAILVPELRRYTLARWGDWQGSITVDRVAPGKGGRRYRQVLFRLWNAAEQTIDQDNKSDPYELTTKLFTHSASEDLIVATTEQRIAFRLRTVTSRFVEHIEDQNGKFLRLAVLRLSQAANSHDIELMSADELDELLALIAPVEQN